MRRISIIFLTLFSLALPARAYVEVENNVRAAVNTGGNSARAGNQSSGGTVVTSEATATVKIKTTIGGIVVEDIDETYKSSAPLEVKKTSLYATTSAEVKTRVSVKAQATSSNATSSQEQVKKAVQERKYHFFSRIKQLFKNVFSRFTF